MKQFKTILLKFIEQLFDNIAIQLLLIVCVFAFAITGSIAAVMVTFAAIDASTMRELGFEAKRVNLDCYAKYNGVFVKCERVGKLQQKDEK